jgi:hypothetical protein
MNKFFLSLLFCGVAAVTVTAYGEQGQQPDVFYLKNGEKMTGSLFDLYNPALKKLCLEQTETKHLCAKLLALAKLANANLTDADRAALREAGLLDTTTDTLKPEVATLVKASLVEDEKTGVSYTNPVQQKLA